MDRDTILEKVKSLPTIDLKEVSKVIERSLKRRKMGNENLFNQDFTSKIVRVDVLLDTYGNCTDDLIENATVLDYDLESMGLFFTYMFNGVLPPIEKVEFQHEWEGTNFKIVGRILKGSGTGLFELKTMDFLPTVEMGSMWDGGFCVFFPDPANKKLSIIYKATNIQVMPIPTPESVQLEYSKLSSENKYPQITSENGTVWKFYRNVVYDRNRESEVPFVDGEIPVW